MWSNPYEKGSFPYMKARKQQYLFWTLLCGGVVALLVALGFIIWHSRKNLLMIPGMLMVIPFANFLTSYLAMALGSREMSAAEREQLAPYEAAGMVLYHLMYCDEKGKRQFLDAVVVYAGGLVGYSPSLKEEDRVPLETDCILRLKKKALPLRLKLYTDWEGFVKRTETVAPAVGEGEEKTVERAKEQLLLMCL